MVVVIGAGISGLSCAWWLRQQGMRVTVLEADSRVGGKVRTMHTPQAVIEAGPNTLLADAALQGWLSELGLVVEQPAPLSRARFVLRGGVYRRLPAGPLSLLAGDYFSWRARLALLSEPFRSARRASTPETVADFFRRRVGAEVLDRAVSPFVGGVFAGDPEQLLMTETLPMLAEAERRAGSISLGILRMALGGGLTRKRPVSLTGGLEALPSRLARDLNVRLATPALSLCKMGAQWRITTTEGELCAEQVVLALPAPAAAALLAKAYPDTAQALNAVRYAPMTVVASLLETDSVSRPLHGFGGLHPASEQAFCAGHLMTGSLYPQRCPPTRTLITSFVGGEGYRRQAALDDAALLAGLNAELTGFFGLARPPVAQHLIRWPQAIPQGTAAIAPARRAMAALANDGLHVCSAWLDGVSVPDCLAKGKRLAASLAALAGPADTAR
ncbi:protoporphyrinogen oxidase [uncultured Aquitalea sp.]|uniref:protoporphyrinogen oxidase n=1 Tax=uncultured Aquitalea sp. TaxID=540272 RepID=UPI0025EAC6E6|nr:protoporphyrinogen oxidase [uncultured Aquitalea sp.]